MKEPMTFCSSESGFLPKCHRYYLKQEIAESKELFKNPKHPYTKALLAAIPVPDISMRHKEIEIIKGEITSTVNPKPGCRFAMRCPYASDICNEPHELSQISTGHFVARAKPL